MMRSDHSDDSQSTAGGGAIRILGRANSFNVRKVLWLCDEIGVPYSREDYGRGYRSTRTPEYLRMNPTAQVPVVIDGDLILRESNTIVRYLASKHRADRLYPPDLAERALVEQWMDWVAYDLTFALRGAFLGGQLQEPPWNNPWFVEQGKEGPIREPILDHIFDIPWKSVSNVFRRTFAAILLDEPSSKMLHPGNKVCV